MNQKPETESVDEPDALLFETSPTGVLDAIVQSDGRTVYFYLNGPEPFGTRACWVRNLVPGPLVVDANDMASGRPPLLPRTSEQPDAPRSVPSPEDLSVIWFEECNGAALLESGEVLAIIPPWSGEDGFWGYARHAAMQSPLCSPLPDHPDLMKRIVRAAEFWAAFEDTEANPFTTLQQCHLQVLKERFGGAGTTEHYFAIDGGKFPPRGLAVFRDPRRIIGVTIGMSLLPQPNVELVDDQPWLRRRVELAWALPANTAESDQQLAWRAISGLASYPWRFQTWFGEGHTIEVPAAKEILGATSQTVRLTACPSPDAKVELCSVRDDPVTLLWMVP